MDLHCPYCARDFFVGEPWDFLGPQTCPRCGRALYVEADESGEGPTFTAYKGMPSCELYPPQQPEGPT